MTNLMLRESSYEELIVFTPKLFYVIHPRQGFVEPVKIIEGLIYVWDSSGEVWENLYLLRESNWIKEVKIYLLEEPKDE